VNTPKAFGLSGRLKIAEQKTFLVWEAYSQARIWKLDLFWEAFIRSLPSLSPTHATCSGGDLGWSGF
jgi:hypothetical protein